MVTKKLVEALESIGFTYSDDAKHTNAHCYAVYGGYLVSVYEKGNNKIAFFSFKFSENEENAVKRYDMSEDFSSKLEEFEVVNYDISEDGMRVESRGNIVTFLKLIDNCIDTLISFEIRGADYCSVCGNKFGSRLPKKVTYGTEEHILCEHCAIEALEEHNKEKQEINTGNGKPVLGVLGSVLFALIGGIIMFALYCWLLPYVKSNGTDISYILCVSGALISFLSYLGYRIFCKKISLCAYITVAVNALLFTAIGQYLGSVFEFVRSNGFGTSALSKKAFWLVHLRNTIPEDLIGTEGFTVYSETFYKLFAISMMFAVVMSAIMLLTLRDKSTVKKEPLKIETIQVKAE